MALFMYGQQPLCHNFIDTGLKKYQMSPHDGNALREIKEDGLQVSVGPVKRARTRHFNEQLNTLIIKLQCDTKDTCIKEEIQEHKSPMLVHIIRALNDEPF